jgi:DNA-binding XRE family transcriptional regulator
MAGKSSLQICNEKCRAIYEGDSQPPLLLQVCMVHGISCRDFASIFGVGKSHASDVLNHKVFPSLELALKISRYWEVTVEELFGWRVDDDGARRPLVVIDPSTGKALKLTKHRGRTGAIELAMKANGEVEESVAAKEVLG